MPFLHQHHAETLYKGALADALNSRDSQANPFAGVRKQPVDDHPRQFLMRGQGTFNQRNGFGKDASVARPYAGYIELRIAGGRWGFHGNISSFSLTR